MSKMSLAQFENYSDTWPIFLSSQTALFGNGLSVYDFDRDGLDDLTIAELNQGIGLYRNNGNGFELIYYHVFIGDIKQIAWVDYDNDLDVDLFFTANGQGIHLLKNEGNFIWSDQSFLFETWASSFAYGAAWADYDRDGLLDVYVCMYDYPGTSVFPNLLFRQLEDHTFEEVGSSLGVASATDEAFQPAWIDFDMDGWLDLYVINDHSVPNEFYHNNEGISFSEIASMNGSNIAQSSMSNSVSDYDNDGDFDIFITDGGAPVLLQNNNQQFIDVAEISGVGQWANNWSALWMDFDLDGYEDLHVCTENPGAQPDNNFFYYNQQNGFFYDSGLDNTNRDSFCAAKGDFNDDGLWDYVVLNGYPPSLDIWVGIGNAPSVKIVLQGTVSNADGVGAFIEYWINGNRRITQTQCGENYISQNSHSEIFALEGQQGIDSLNVMWPSGWIDHYENLIADSSYLIIEGETIAYLNMFSEYQTCPGDSILLTVEGNDNFIWENGDTSSQRWVNTPGQYAATFVNDFGFEYSHFYEVNNWNIPEVTALVVDPLCADGTDGQIQLITDASQFVSFLWSDGEEGAVRNDLMAGMIACTLTTIKDCPVELSFELNEPTPIIVENDLDKTVCHSTTTTVSPEVSGGIAPYSINWMGDDPENLGEGEHLFEVIDANGCVASFSFMVTWTEPIELTLFADTVCPGDNTSIVYSATGGSGNLTFDFDEIDPENVGAGLYEIAVYDEQFCFAAATIEVVAFEAMQSEVQITPAEDGPNGGIELIITGGTAPYLYLWNTGDTSPTIENLPQGVYTCSVSDANGCVIEVEAVVIDTHVDRVKTEVHIYPRNFGEYLLINVEKGETITILDLSGKIHFYTTEVGEHRVDTSSWATGIYFAVIGNFDLKALHKQY